ncbi:MAG: hypothetical protein ISS33_05850 [Candidatus Omnitrophica bacterium]|nr:hypothetical protein [Candidatus Omnitrophota bacterium]
MQLKKRGLIVKRGIGCFVIALFLSVVFLEAAFSLPESSVPVGWKEHKDAHFIIYSAPEIPDKYIRDFSRKCEKYYRQITDRLGFSRFNFWLWEDRATIFVYTTREAYVEGTGRKSWSGAYVQVRKKIINTFYFEQNFFDVILPHELAHIILREFVGVDTRLPLWFDEGVACSNEKNSLPRYLLPAKSLVEKNEYIALRDLSEVNGRTIKDAKTFYLLSASLVIFLLEEHGKTRFVSLCKEIRDGREFWDAIFRVYGFETPEDMDIEFIEYIIGKNYQNIVTADNMSVNW